MADYFDAYLKGMQMKAYRSQLDRSAEVEQGMRAMNGLPQQAPMVGGFLGMGQHPDPNFQPMTAQQGEATARALDPTAMDQRDVRRAQLGKYRTDADTAERTRRADAATRALATLDAVAKISDPLKRQEEWKNTLGPQLVADNPGMAEHISKIDLSDEGLQHGRAELIAAGAKDPTTQGVGRPRDRYVGTMVKLKNGNLGIFDAEKNGVTDTGVAWAEEYSQVPVGGGVTGFAGKHDPSQIQTPSATTAPAPTAPTPAVAGAPPVTPPAATPAAPLDMTPAGIAERERNLAEEKAAGAERGKGQEARLQTTIDEGRDAAKGIPTLNRVLELLDSVKTGGFAQAALSAKSAFGVQGADEAELSSALGQAVLKDLRVTFGNAFTEREGEGLKKIRAQFGMSAEANRRLIEQALAIAKGAADRAMKEAADSGDYRSAALIKETMSQSLSNPGAKKPIQERGDELEKSGMTKEKIIETLKAEGYGT